MAPIYLDPLNNGRDTPPTGNPVPGSLFTGAFAMPGSRSLARDRARGRVRLVDVVQRDRPPRPRRSTTRRKPMTRRGELADAITAWTAERSPHTAAQLLQNVGLAAGAVYDNEDTVRDPQLRARGASVEIDQPDLGVIEYYQSPHRMTKTPGFVRRRGPRLGEHTCEVLQEWLESRRARDPVPKPPTQCGRRRRRADRRGAGAVRYPRRHRGGRVRRASASKTPRSAPPTSASTTSTRRPAAIDRLDAAELANLAVPIGDRIAGLRGGRAAARRWHRSSVAAKTASKRRSSCSAATPVHGSSPGPAAPRPATPRSRHSSPPYRGCASRSTPATSRRGAAIRFRCCATPTTCNCARPRRDARSCTPTRVATSTSPRCSPSSSGSTIPVLLSIEYFNLPDYGWPLDDPVGHAVALAELRPHAHVRVHAAATMQRCGLSAVC